MKTRTYTITIASAIAVGVLAYLLLRRKKVKDRLDKVADAGYETAYDILYPLQ